jgi:hypothetical protein
MPDERLDSLSASARAAMDAIDAHYVMLDRNIAEIRMYVAPKTGHKYITLVGMANGRPFAEVFGAVTDAPDWDSTIKALVKREGF